MKEFKKVKFETADRSLAATIEALEEARKQVPDRAKLWFTAGYAGDGHFIIEAEWETGLVYAMGEGQ